METYSAILANCHPNFDPHSLDLHHAVTLQLTTPAGLYLVRRHDVPPSIADVVAQLAGFGVHDEVL